MPSRLLEFDRIRVIPSIHGRLLFAAEVRQGAENVTGADCAAPFLMVSELELLAQESQEVLRSVGSGDPQSDTDDGNRFILGALKLNPGATVRIGFYKHRLLELARARTGEGGDATLSNVQNLTFTAALKVGGNLTVPVDDRSYRWSDRHRLTRRIADAVHVLNRHRYRSRSRRCRGSPRHCLAGRG